jgi:hypothetical protein
MPSNNNLCVIFSLMRILFLLGNTHFLEWLQEQKYKPDDEYDAIRIALNLRKQLLDAVPLLAATGDDMFERDQIEQMAANTGGGFCPVVAAQLVQVLFGIWIPVAFKCGSVVTANGTPTLRSPYAMCLTCTMLNRLREEAHAFVASGASA